MPGGARNRAITIIGLCFGAIVATPAGAAAEPAPDPALPAEVIGSEVPPIVDPFIATSQITKQSPLAAFVDVLAQASPDIVLAPSTTPGGVPAPDPLASIAMLTPKNYRMPTGELPSPYVLATGVPPGPFARVDGWKGVHAMIHAGLGRMPGVELGQALPGTAPPPGTALPPGLVQFLPDPVELVPADPAAPLIPPPVSPAG